MTPTSTEGLEVIAQGYRKSCVLFAALELSLFDALDKKEEGLTSVELADELQTHRTGVEALLDSLVAFCLVRRREGRYSNSPELRPYLIDGEHSLKRALLHQQDEMSRWACIAGRMRQEPVARENIEDRIFAGHKIDDYLQMVKVANTHRANELVKLLAMHFAEASRIMDLAGGHGLYSEMLIARMPHIEVTIVDLSSSIEYARRTMKHSTQIAFEVGDARSLAYHEVFDGVMVNDLLHSFGSEDKQLILRNSLAALKPGGRLVVGKLHLERDSDQPNSNHLFSLKMFINSAHGYLETDQEIVCMIQMLGARVVAKEILAGAAESVVIVAEKIRP